nr:breast cancer type 1 susceptibility protein [Hymenolepis microstoma]
MLQQAFRCPICLESMQNARVSPCSHIFCNLCLERTISGRSSTTCPLCKKQFPTRAFAPSNKFDQISKAIKEIVDNFSEESQTEFVPATRFEPLHLSQEFSQALPQQPKGTPKKRACTARFSVRNTRIEQIAKATKRAPVEFFKHIKVKTSNHRSSYSKEESQSLLSNQADDNEQTESNHQNELFTLTQTPLLAESRVLDFSDFPDLSIKKNSIDCVEDDNQNRSFMHSRRPRLLSTVKKHVFRSLSRERKRRLGSPDSQNSTVSSCSVIPPLRERLSLMSTPTERTKSSPPKLRGRKRRRLSNELYSPWLRNSRMHFLKKYRIPSQPPISRSASSELPSGQSPSWSSLKSLTGDMARVSKRPPLLFSSKKKVDANLSTSSAEKSSIGVREARKFPKCRFSLPAIVGWKFKETVSPEAVSERRLICASCGSEMLLFPKSNDCIAPTNPSPCPQIHAETSYFPDSFICRPTKDTEKEEKGGRCASANVTPIRNQVMESPGLMSVVTIQPSCIPQTFSLNSKPCSGRSSPSTINIQPSMVPQSLSLTTFAPKTQTQGESGELPGGLDLTVALVEATDTHPTPQVPSSSNTPATLISEVPQGPSSSVPSDTSPKSIPRGPKESKTGKNGEMEEDAVGPQQELETMDIEEDDIDVISASPTSSSNQPTTIPEPPRSLECSHSRTVGVEGIDEDVDIIPSSQNEEAEDVMGNLNTTVVARVESSQAGVVPTAPQTLGPLPITDTIPFTQAASRPLQTSIIADTENVFGRNDEESPQPTIYITGSNLTAEQANAVHRFCATFNAKETPTFDPAHTTHVVITTSDKNPRVATRTLKYFMAVLYGTWLVNPFWIRDCLRENKILPEEPYEIRGDYQCETLHEGPRKGRLRLPSLNTTIPFSSNSINMQASSSHIRDCRPFVDLVICPFKSINPLSIHDFEAIVIAGGGTFVKDICHVNADVIRATREAVLGSNGAIEDSITHMDGNKKCLVITQPRVKGFNKTECVVLFEKYKIPVIGVSWLLNCAASYSRLPLSNTYTIYAKY